jgi:hypothetical protein
LLAQAYKLDNDCVAAVDLVGGQERGCGHGASQGHRGPRARCIFHASFDAAINQLSYDVVTASNAARLLIFSAVIVLAATTVIIATKGKLGRARETVRFMPVYLNAKTHD